MSEEVSSSRARRKKAPLWRQLFNRYQTLGLFSKIALWCVLASPVVAVVGYKVAKPLYRNWKQENALRMAGEYVAKGDAKSAFMAFRQALRANPRNPDAWRQVARYLDGLGAPDAISVWGEVVRRSPNDLDARFSAIEAMLAHGRWGGLKEALDQVPEGGREDARYQRAIGVLALQGKDYATAISRLEAAAQRNPNLPNLQRQLNIAKLRGGSITQKVEAVDALEAMSKDASDSGAQALRELLSEAADRKDEISMRVYARRLMDHPAVTLRDQIVYADFELSNGGMFFPVMQKKLFEAGQKKPDQIPAIVGYLLARGRASAVGEWLENLPADMASDPGVQAGRLELALARRDWTAAFASLRAGAAGAIPEETVSQAEKAFGALDSNRGSAVTAWQAAIAAADNSPEGLLALAKLAKAYGWDEAQLKALWALAEVRPGIPEVWSDLVRLEGAQKNLNGLHQALYGALQADPENFSLRSNFVVISFLLGRGDPEDILRLAESAYGSAPQNPYFVTSYALALANAGQTDRAVETIEKLSPAEASLPDRALYRGVIYSRASRKEDARAALAAAGQNLDAMMPEEVLLYRSTIAGLEGKALSKEEMLAALKESRSSEEEKEQIAAALRAGRTQQSGETQELVESLRNGKFKQDGSSDILKELEQQRSGGSRSPAEMKALMDEIRSSRGGAKEEE